MEKNIDRWLVHLHALNSEGVWYPPQLEPRPDAWIIIEYRADDYGCIKFIKASSTWSRGVQRWMYLPVNAQGHEPNTLAGLFAESGKSANENAHPTL